MNHSPFTPTIRIQADKMDLTVNSIRPVFREAQEIESRLAISAKLYSIFGKYDTSVLETTPSGKADGHV